MELLANYFRQDLFSHLGEWVVAASMVLVRVLAFMHMAPIFSHKSVSNMARMGFAVLVTAMLFSAKEFETPPGEGYHLIYPIIVNVALGLLMGFVAKMMFAIPTAGGEMMDSSMGFSSGQTFDPSSGHQTTIIGRFMSTLVIVVYFAVSGPEMLLRGLSNSFDSFGLYNPNMQIDIAKLIGLSGDIIEMGFLIVSPVVLTILVNDIVLGLISRASPQINAFQISFTIKPSIGSIIFLIIMPLYFMGLTSLLTDTSRLF